jgi:DnaK suppressor protein
MCMVAKKPSGKASKHKQAAPKKAVAKRAKPIRGRVTAHRAAPPSPKKPAHPPKLVKLVEKPRIAVKGPQKSDKSTQKSPVKVADKVQPRGKPIERPRPPTAPAFTLPPRFVPMPSVAEGDDGDGDSNASLLAGPRNVRPYIARRGEQYMNKEQLDHFRLILYTWKRDLMEEVDRTVLHMKDEAANFPDPNDRATQESEFSLELRTRDRERKLIRKIDEALKRIEDGSYGYCLETGEEIGIKRLEARPVATLCVEAQERRERREKQYGDRDDRYR